MLKRIWKLKLEIGLGIVPVIFLFVGIAAQQMLPLLFAGLVLSVVLGSVLMRNGAFGGKKSQRAGAGSASPLTFDQIGGQDRAKSELIEALEFLTNKEQIARLGIRPLKGILLTGPPGTGKTLLARAAAQYTNAAFVSAAGSEFVEMYVGVGASRIRELFQEARTKAERDQKNNIVIFIDEIDVIGGKREGGQQREYDQTLNQLLTEMDGIQGVSEPRILMIAATNRKEMLDSALLRPGRFDRHIEVDLPDKKGRLAILDIHARNKPLDKQADLSLVAEQTFGFSGAQLESVLNEAAIYALREQAEAITAAHLSAGIDKVMMGEQTDREANAEEKERVAYHELGHAIMAEVVRAGSVAQVSLTPRGKALGYVRHNPKDERYLYTKDEIEGQIMIALGGAAAEEIIYAGRSTGSRNDFEQAMNLVGLMVDCGLTSLGIVDARSVPKKELYESSVSILNDLFARTKKLLLGQRHALERGIEILLRDEVLSGNQFRTFFKQTA